MCQLHTAHTFDRHAHAHWAVVLVVDRVAHQLSLYTLFYKPHFSFLWDILSDKQTLSEVPQQMQQLPSLFLASKMCELRLAPDMPCITVVITVIVINTLHAQALYTDLHIII